MRKFLCYMIALLVIALFSACGNVSKSPSNGSTIKAVIKPSALTAEQNVAGIKLAITVPVGVAPPLLAGGSVDTVATVEITSSALQNQNLPGVTYTPATAAVPGRLEVYAVVASGFKPTDEITIHLKVAVGTIPVESDFQLISFEAFDTNGAPVTGLSPTLTTTIH